MDVIAVDISCGKTGTTGVAEVSDGIVIGTYELSSPVSPITAFELCQKLWSSSPSPRRLLVVERPFEGKSARDALDLARAQERWITVGELLGARTLSPLASQWRARGSRGGFRALDRWMIAGRLPKPRRRQIWKATAKAFVLSQIGQDVSDHVAEAICMGLWGEEQANLGDAAAAVDVAVSMLGGCA